MCIIELLHSAWNLICNNFSPTLTIITTSVVAITSHGSLHSMILFLSFQAHCQKLPLGFCDTVKTICLVFPEKAMTCIYILMTPTFIFLTQNFPELDIHLES